MSYTQSPFQPGDIVETTEEYRTWAEKCFQNCYEKRKMYTKGLVSEILTLQHTDTKEPLQDYIKLDNGFVGRCEDFQKPSFKCPDCKEETEIVKFNGGAYFSCNNIFCGNIKLYDVFTLFAKIPKIEKVTV